MASTDPPTPDWATFVTNQLDGIVGLIRDKSLRPATQAVRYVVVGTLAAIVGLAMFTMLIIGLMRLLNTTVFRGHVFATYLVVGGILLIAGVFLLRASAKIGRMS